MPGPDVSLWLVFHSRSTPLTVLLAPRVGCSSTSTDGGASSGARAGGHLTTVLAFKAQQLRTHGSTNRLIRTATSCRKLTCGDTALMRRTTHQTCVHLVCPQVVCVVIQCAMFCRIHCVELL